MPVEVNVQPDPPPVVVGDQRQVAEPGRAAGRVEYADGDAAHRRIADDAAQWIFRRRLRRADTLCGIKSLHMRIAPLQIVEVPEVGPGMRVRVVDSTEQVTADQDYIRADTLHDLQVEDDRSCRIVTILN